MSAEKRANELARLHVPGQKFAFDGEEFESYGEDWIVTRLPANDYNRREFGHEYQLERRNSVNQGWVCGSFSADTAKKLSLLLDAITLQDEIGI